MVTIDRQQQTWALGMTKVDDIVELYGVDSCGNVMLHGWFPKATGISLLSERASCVVVVDELMGSKGLASSLERMGHSTIVVPAAAPATNADS